MRPVRAIASLLIVIASVAACADLPSQGYASAPRVAERVEYGVVERIDLYREGSTTPNGLGAVLGGIAGGVIGHQIGSGRGNTVGTIAGQRARSACPYRRPSWKSSWSPANAAAEAMPTTSTGSR